MGVALFANNAKSTLAANINNSVTTLSVAVGTGSKFPAISDTSWFPIVLRSASFLEICRCIDRSGDVLTVVRAQEGTAAHAFTAGDIVALRVTRDTYNQFLQDGAMPLAIAKGGTASTNAAAARTALGLAIGSAVQAFSTTLQTLSALVTTAFGRAFLTDATEAAFKTRVNLEKDVDFLGYELILKNLRDLALPAANKIPYLIGVATWAFQSFTATDRAFLGAANVGEQRTSLGLGDLAELDIEDLVYVGSNNANTDFPIGTTVILFSTVAFARNASRTVRLSTADTALYLDTGLGAVLLGTWRSRSHARAGDDNGYLMQRTD